MKKFLIVVLLLCLLVVGGIVGMALMSFNPSAYERDVVAYLQRLTGREVSVGGTTAISWNPEPTVTMQNVKISNMDKAKNPIMLSIEKVKVSIAWESLLKSPLEIKRIELTRPVLYLERLESNRANYSFPFLLDPNFQLQEMAILSDPASATTKIDTILIKDGRIGYENQITGTAFQVTDVNGTLAVDTVRGPYRFKGTGMSGKGQYAVEASVGTFQGSTPVPVTVQLSESNTRLDLKTTGNLTPVGVDKWYDGAIRYDIGRLEALLTDLNWPIPDLSAGAVASGTATLIIAPASDMLKDFVITIGEEGKGTALTGKITRTISGKKYAYDADVSTNLLRLNQWKNYWNLLNWEWLSGEKEYPNIRFKVYANDVLAGQVGLQEVSLKGNYQNNVLTMEESQAKLPGGGKLTLTAVGKSQNPEPYLDIGLRVETPKFGEMLSQSGVDQKWAQMPILNQKSNFIGRVVVTPKDTTINADELKIGSVVVKGTVQKTAEKGYMAKVSVDGMNVDDLTGWKVPEKPMPLAKLPAQIKQALTQMTGTEETNVQAVIDLNQATLFGVPADRMYIEATLNKQVLKIDRFIAQNWGGGDMAMMAVLNGVGRSQLIVNGFQMGLKSKQVASLLKRFNLNSELPLINQAEEGSLKISLNGGKDDIWNVETVAELSNATIKLAGLLIEGDTLGIQNMAFELAHPNFQTFMKLLDPNFKALPKLDGIFKAVGHVSITKDRLNLKNTTVTVGLQQLSGALTFDKRQIKTLTADLTAPTLDLERFTNDVNPFYSEVNGLSKKVLDLSALNDWNGAISLKATQLVYKDLNIRQADAQITLQNKELNLAKLTGMSGTSDQAPVMMNAKLDWNTTPTLTAQFDLQNIPLRPDFMVLPELAIGGGNLSVKGNIKARGETPADFMTNLNGQGTLSLRGGQIIGADVEQMIPIITRAIQRSEGAKVIEPEFKRVLNSGKTVLQTVSGDYVIANGVVRMMDLTLNTANAIANPTQIIWDIPKRTLDISIPVLLKPLNSLPPFILGISVLANQGTYKPNYADLLAVLSNRSQTALANDLRQKEAYAREAAMRKRSDRLAESKSLTADARTAVANMEQKMVEFPFEKGSRLLATAKDTLVLLNQLAVKEDPTDAQLIQQIEYARTVLLKADEFNRALEQETLFSTQKKMAEYRQKSTQMAEQLKLWAKAYPDIVVLAKLSDNAEQNRQIVEQSTAKLSSKMSVAEANELVGTCAEAVDKIEKAYQHATRFDLSGVPNQVTGENYTPKKQVRGSFKRSE